MKGNDHMLNSFEGADVLQAQIKITRAGDGLSEALQVEPIEHHVGDIVHVVLRCRVGGVTLEPVKPGKDSAELNILKRVHKFVTEAGTIVDADLVTGVLDEQKRKIDAARGVHALPFDAGLDLDD